MDGWRVDPAKLRALREEAELRVVDLAGQLGCHPRHYWKFERGTAQPSAVLGHALLRILGARLQRNISFSDIARPVPSRRKAVA